MKFQILIPFLVANVAKSYASILEAKLAGGTVRGGFCNGTNSSSVFLGIPYAIPPVDQLRWEAPLAFNATFGGGTLNATRRPAICYQFGTNDTATEPGPYSENW